MYLLEDHQKVCNQLQKLKEDFETLSAAHNKLKERCSFFKEETRKYRDFYEKWLLETEKKKALKKRDHGYHSLRSPSAVALLTSLSPARSIQISSGEPTAVGIHQDQATSSLQSSSIPSDEELATIAEHRGQASQYTQGLVLSPDEEPFTVAEHRGQVYQDIQALESHFVEEPFTVAEHQGLFQAASVLRSPTPRNESGVIGDEDRHDQQDTASRQEIEERPIQSITVARPQSSSETCDDTPSQKSVRDTDFEVKALPARAVEESDSDVPVIVSTRCLKRKRPSAATYREREVVVHEDPNPQIGSSAKPVPIKNESRSNTPTLQRQLTFSDFTHDSLDLDEVGGTGFTPRKRKKFDNRLPISQGRESLKVSHLGINISTEDYNKLGKLFADYFRIKHLDQHLNQPTGAADHSGDLGARIEQRSNGGVRQGVHSTSDNREQNVQALGSNYVTSKQPVVLGVNVSSVQGHREPTDLPTHHVRSTKPSTFRTANPAALQPKDSNVQILSRGSNRSVSFNDSSNIRQSKTAAKVSKLAEDGENYSANENSQSTHISVDLSWDQSHTRDVVDASHAIENLLEERTPDRPILPFPRRSTSKMSRLRPPLATTPPQAKAGDQVCPHQDLIKESKSGTTRRFREPPVSTATPRPAGPKTPRASDLGPVSASSPKKPLRDLPLDRLHLEDFKINPVFNQDLASAFSGSSRSPEQRKCLPNCNKPGCCGEKYRKMVEIGGFITPDKSNVGQFSTMDKQDEEQMLLDYSGKSRQEVSRLSRSEKQRLVIDVQARMFGDKYGKHKQNQRPPTPPGFWRTDMPTTPEAKADREAAVLAERQQVEERYLDALQANGRWRFRDE